MLFKMITLVNVNELSYINYLWYLGFNALFDGQNYEKHSSEESRYFFISERIEHSWFVTEPPHFSSQM